MLWLIFLLISALSIGIKILIHRHVTKSESVYLDKITDLSLFSRLLKSFFRLFKFIN